MSLDTHEIGAEGRLSDESRGFAVDYDTPDLNGGEPRAPRAKWKRNVSEFWVRNKGLAMVMASQFFAMIMDTATRLLEHGDEHAPPLHPLHILLARMVGTLVLSLTYQWWANVKDAPLGPRKIWGLLFARGIGGFFGVYGMYYSLRFLNLSDAVVISFLAPTVACFACSILIKEPFTRPEQVAGLISFVGVVLIARPASLFSRSTSSSASASSVDAITMSMNGNLTLKATIGDTVTAQQRLGAVGWALLGVLGAACAYTTIRWIGQRAHPLICVNYFAGFTTLISFVGICVVPGINFRLPGSLAQWSYMVMQGVCGFIMQYLLTKGLAYEKSSRATNMVYTLMLFALASDKFVFDESPTMMSAFGSSLILASVLYVAILNTKGKETEKNSDQGPDEEMAMLASHDDMEADDTDGSKDLAGDDTK